MITNKDISNKVFEVIKSMGYKPYGITYHNGYFLCDMGEDSVVHFKLHGLGLLSKHWKFGMWIDSSILDNKVLKQKTKQNNVNLYDLKVIRIFAQYDMYIDKFKPSRSAFLVEYDVDDWKILNESSQLITWYKLKDMLGMMKKHPFMSFCYDDSMYDKYYNTYFFKDFFIRTFVYDLDKLKKKVVISIVLPYIKVKIWIASKSDIVSNVMLEESFFYGRDYDVIVKFSANVTESQMVNWLNRWWKKDEYGYYSKCECVCKLWNRFSQDGNDKRISFTRGEQTYD